MSGRRGSGRSSEQNGRMWATVGEDDGAIVLSGACIAP